MKIKTVKVGEVEYAALDAQGLPIYVHNDGREIGFDAQASVTRIAGLNRESQTHRESLEAAQLKLKGFEGIDDPEAARAALGTIGNLKAGDLKTAEQVEEIKREARKAAEQQVADTARQSATRLQELEQQANKYRDELYAEKVGGSFSRSEFVQKRIAVPADMLQDRFGKNFKVEDGKIVPYGPDGNKIYSRTRPGEVADFEEGLEFLVESYPHKGQILKGTGHSGTGAPQGTAPLSPGGKPTMTRTAFEALGPTEKRAAVASHQLVDGPA